MWKGWIIMGLGLALVGLVGCGEMAEERWQVAQQLAAVAAPRLTYRQYMRIQSGMGFQDVETILGGPGQELASNQIAGYRTVMYSWSNRDGSGLNVMFQNGFVIQKAQFGLR